LEKEKMMAKIKYPEITVELSDSDGNAYAIISKVVRALRKGSVSETYITKFKKEAMSYDYDNVLQTCMKWVNVE